MKGWQLSQRKVEVMERQTFRVSLNNNMGTKANIKKTKASIQAREGAVSEARPGVP